MTIYIIDVTEAELPDSGIIALEGDFGGGQKVNQYIQTGDGSAAEAAVEKRIDLCAGSITIHNAGVKIQS